MAEGVVAAAAESEMQILIQEAERITWRHDVLIDDGYGSASVDESTEADERECDGQNTRRLKPYCSDTMLILWN